MMTELNHEPVLTTDFNSKTSLWRGLALVLLGWLVAFFVKNDGIFSRRIQIDIIGPNPSLVNDMPYLGSVLLILAGLLLIFLVGLAIKSGSIDRVVLGMFAFSLNADVVPMLFQISVIGFCYILVDRGLRQRRIPFRLTPMVVLLGLMMLSYSVSFFTNHPAVIVDVEHDISFNVHAVGGIVASVVNQSPPSRYFIRFHVSGSHDYSRRRDCTIYSYGYEWQDHYIFASVV